MWAAVAFTTALTLAADGQPELKNVRFTYGIMGAERKDAAVIPGDSLIVAFDIDGLKVADDGKVQYSTMMQLNNKDGKPEFEEKPNDRETINTLGGSRVPCWSLVNIGTDTAAGSYTVKVTVKDRSSGKEASFDRKFEVAAPKFGIIRTALAYDKPPTAPPPAPPVAVPGQSLLAFFTIVNFETKPGKPKEALACDVHVEMNVLDDKDQPTLKKPYVGDIKEVAEDYKSFLPFQFPLLLNRPGKYKVVFKATDNFSKKSSDQTIEINVVEVK
jgi:hypothetical protein